MPQDQQQEVFEKVTNNGLFQTMRIVPVVMGFAFAGIGLTIIIFLWSAQGFGAPPLFFKMIGSFISLVFMTVGSSTALAALKGKSTLQHLRRLSQQSNSATHRAKNYHCPSCGAALPSDADISPSGDVKCTYCNSWFNTR